MFNHPELNITKFDSPAEFAAECGKVDRIVNKDISGQRDWYGQHDFAQTARRCINGDDKLVPAAQRLMDKYDAIIPNMTLMDMPSVMGGYVCVPEALSGEPECMRIEQETEGERGPLHIVVDMAPSAVLSTQDMERRGVAIMALVMALAATRPVTLDIAGILSGKRRDAEPNSRFSIITVRINTTPLDLATASYMLTHVAPVRLCMFNWAREHWEFSGAYGSFDGITFDSEYAARKCEPTIRRLLDITDETLYIPGPRSGDEVIRNPESWVRKQLDTYAAHMSAA